MDRSSAIEARALVAKSWPFGPRAAAWMATAAAVPIKTFRRESSASGNFGMLGVRFAQMGWLSLTPRNADVPKSAAASETSQERATARKLAFS